MMRILVFVFCCLLMETAFSAKDNTAATLSPRVYKKLKKTEQLISKKSYSQAEHMLKTMLANVKQKSFAQATVLRSLSSVYALKGDYKKAAQTLRQCISLKILPKEQEIQALLNLGQLYMALEQYSKAVKTLEPWLAKNPNPDVQISILLANAYAQLKQYRKALPYITNAISRSKKPQEAWYQLNLALYYELNNYAAAATVLRKLIRRYPDNKTYWLQLASVYQQLNQYKRAAAIQSLAYKKGFFDTEKELLDYVNLLSYIGYPYKAAKILRHEMDRGNIKSNSKNWEMLAQQWTLAKENAAAINALKTASKLDSKGKLYQQLGQIYIEQERWKLAINALNKAIQKGGISNKGNTLILLGMSYYELGQVKQAKKVFFKATQYIKTRKAARQWLQYLKSPQE